jgi:UDP-N-acetylmuramoyl-tripeptide--D-alanyl-D-alanine ligase
MTKNALWTAKDAVTATKGSAPIDFAANGISIDTRTLAKGDLFVALKGDHLDGHAYVAAAFKAGASAAMVSRDFKHENPDWPLLYVDDTMKGLEDLGRAARKRSRAKIIGVAGSVGKTGTKELLATLFGSLGKTHASKKSFNNHWGVPLSLANLPADAEYGIFEIGMNHPGEITLLTDQVKPDIAIITTIDREHIEFFPNGLEGVADANAEIFKGMGKDSIAILNADNIYFKRLSAAAGAEGVTDIRGFGEEDKVFCRLLDCTLFSDGSSATADINGRKVKYALPISGKHIVMNALGALAVVDAAGGDVEKAALALKNVTPVAGRGNRYYVTIAAGQPPVTIIDESYNANPASMQAAFDVFELVEPPLGGRRIAVLGDMLELGREGPKLHADLANPLLKAKTDKLFCCGPLMEALYQQLPEDWRGAHTKDSRALADQLIAEIKPGDVVLVKGSLGSKMAYIIEALQGLQKPGTKGQHHAL